MSTSYWRAFKTLRTFYQSTRSKDSLDGWSDHLQACMVQNKQYKTCMLGVAFEIAILVSPSDHGGQEMSGTVSPVCFRRRIVGRAISLHQQTCHPNQIENCVSHSDCLKTCVCNSMLYYIILYYIQCYIILILYWMLFIVWNVLDVGLYSGLGWDVCIPNYCRV